VPQRLPAEEAPPVLRRRQHRQAHRVEQEGHPDALDRLAESVECR
jgi:hypothetical protein